MTKEKILTWLIQLLLERVASDDLKQWVDSGLDMLENKVAESPSKTDDIVVLPLIGLMRESFAVPDNDE